MPLLNTLSYLVIDQITNKRLLGESRSFSWSLTTLLRDVRLRETVRPSFKYDSIDNDNGNRSLEVEKVNAVKILHNIISVTLLQSENIRITKI